jgi:hypothetical protein
MSKYHIFISHAWKYDSDYNTVVGWLQDSDLDYANYSVPEHDPLDANNKTKLKQMLTGQINPSNIVIVISGMYAVYSDWIDYEIDEAVRLNKVIIGLKPWGQQKVPQKIQNNAAKMVGWNSASLISAIKNH